MKNNSSGIDTHRLAINMFFSIVAFILNIAINFFVAPYITSKFGSEAYGFVKLANDFASYASLISIALNSMASRFIMIDREKGNSINANKYYSSVMYANVILSIILVIPSVLCVFYINNILKIPQILLKEVKITFFITFMNFIINLLFSIYSNCFYISNRLDISSIKQAESNIIRVMIIVIMLFLFTPHISYVALGTLVSTMYLCIINYTYSKKLTPDLEISARYFDFKKLLEILSSGIWNSITKLSQIFSSGLDLLITNLFVNAQMMGYLSVAKTIPNLITTFNSTIANVFSPNLMQLYAKNDIENLKKAIKLSMKSMCIFVTIPNAILITMGEDFFRLWVPDQPAYLLNILSILTVINSCVTGPAQPLYQIFTITNKIKESSIIMIVYGLSSIIITYTILNITNFGVYAVAGVSLIGSILVALFYHIPFAAKYINLPKKTFFPEIIKSCISLFVISIIGWIINNFIIISSWISWFFAAILTSIIGLVANVIIILNKHDKRILFEIILKKLRKG